MFNQWTQVIAYSPDGGLLAMGAHDSVIYILETKSYSLKVVGICNNRFITITIPHFFFFQRLKYSFAFFLSFAHISTRQFKLKGHSSFITCFDFSSDGRFIQSTSNAGELMFWNCVEGERVLSTTAMRDVKWATFNCVLGWPVQVHSSPFMSFFWIIVQSNRIEWCDSSWNNCNYYFDFTAEHTLQRIFIWKKPLLAKTTNEFLMWNRACGLLVQRHRS